MKEEDKLARLTSFATMRLSCWHQRRCRQPQQHQGAELLQSVREAAELHLLVAGGRVCRAAGGPDPTSGRDQQSSGVQQHSGEAAVEELYRPENAGRRCRSVCSRESRTTSAQNTSWTRPNARRSARTEIDLHKISHRAYGVKVLLTSTVACSAVVPQTVNVGQHRHEVPPLLRQVGNEPSNRGQGQWPIGRPASCSCC